MKKVPNIFKITAILFALSIIVNGCDQIDYVGHKSPEYLDHVQERINFGTVHCDNTLQWDTLTQRINSFFIKNTQYRVPDSINIDVIEYTGIQMAGFDVPIYFQGEPTEIFVVSFNSSSYNHIDYVYKVDFDTVTRIKTETLNELEKTRILERLDTEVISKINWDISGIKF